jgi:hypothetical protein
MKTVLPAILLLCLSMGSALAGMCMWSPEYYLECLEGKHTGERDCEEPYVCLECVGIPTCYYKRWGNAAERKRLFSMREVPYRDRLIAVAQQYLSDRGTREEAVDVLAFLGVSRIDDVGVFEEVINQDRQYDLWYTLAALQDPRTIAFAEERFDSVLASGGTIDDEARGQLMDIVDCLYHFRGKESRAALKRMADGVSDEKIKGYIHETAGLKLR